MAFLVFILGTILGSFYLVVGSRLPKNEDILTSRSKCDFCNHILSWWQLIPIISYIGLRGKCHYCKKKISPLNMIVEVVTGLLFLFALLYFKVSYEMFGFIIISSLVIIIFISDFNYFIINDSPLIITVILFAILKFIYFGYKSVLISLATGIFLFCAMLLIKLLGDFLFKKESLGGGDIKLAFVVGFILNIPLGLLSLILSSFLALPYSYTVLMIKKNNEVPFGPFLASSLLIIFVFIDKFESLLALITYKI